MIKGRRRGISVLIEAIVVAIMVISAFAVSYYYITPSNPLLQRNQVNLNQLGFNILNSLASENAFDSSIINGTAIFNYYNNCSRTAPSVVVTPPIKWTSAGQQVAYTVTVVNNDYECGTETFSLIATAPSASWTLSFSQSYVFVPSNGGQGSVTLYVVSPTTAPLGNNSISITAVNVTPGLSSSVASGTGAGVYWVMNSCVYAAPSIAVNPPAGWPKSNTTVMYTAVVVNNDSPLCGNGLFRLTITIPNNGSWIATFSGGSSNNASITISVPPAGGSVSVDYWITPKSGFSGSRNINITATNLVKGIPPSLSTASVIAPYTQYMSCKSLPSTTILPPSQWKNASTTASYTVVVVDNDGGGSCGSDTYTLSLPSASGWTFSYPGGNSITLNSPGATGNVTLNVTSPSATSGNLSFSITTTSQYSKTSVSNAMYVINQSPPSSCTPRVPPSLALYPPSEWGVAGSMLTYTVQIVNNDPSPCGNEYFVPKATVPSGFSASFSSNNITIPSGGNASSFQVFVTSSSGSLLGLNSFTVSASTTGGPTGTAKGVYYVLGSCAFVSYSCLSQIGGIIPGWQRTIGLALQTLVPQGYIYNLSVEYLAVSVYSPYNLTSIPLNNGVVISNGSPTAFKNAVQVGEVNYVYTTPKLYILLFQLQLAQVTSP
jgi:hypothetical protein